MAKEFEYEILEQLGEFSNNGKGMIKEVNIISWNGADGKVDIRNWREDHSRMGKGISLTHEEARRLMMKKYKIYRWKNIYRYLLYSSQY